MTSDSRSHALLWLLAALFVGVGAVTLYLAAPTPALTPRHLLALVGGWGLTWGAAAWLLHRRLPEGDLLFLPPVALLTGWGLLLLVRTAPGFLSRQLLWLFLGVGVLCTVALLPTLPRLLRRYRYTLLAVGLGLLALTLVLGVNPSGAGARLWLNLAGFYFQPSELLKLILVVYLAAYLSDRRELLEQRVHGRPLWLAVLGPMTAMVGLALILLAWQEDLGAALLFYLTFLAMLYLAWGRPLTVVAGLLLFGPVMAGGALLSSRVALRVSIWLDPWAPEQADRAFQILQSLFALAAGGLPGEGLGQGLPTLIPAVHTDFVYAALVEEFGAVGAMALTALLAFLVGRSLRLAQRATTPFEALLAGGIAALLGIQTWVIAAGNIKLIPITGVTLPLLSYGGSSLVTTLMAVGLLLNLSAPHPAPLTLTLPADQAPPLSKTAAWLGLALLFLLTTTALGTGYWAITEADLLRAYPTNPRRILAESRIQRGTIVDRRGELLAAINVDERGFVERTYPIPEAAPVVGYATLQYGTAEIERTCDTRLRGEVGLTPWEALQDRLLHRTRQGQPVALTLDARLQRLAQQQLAGRRGAAVLVDAHTGEILVLASAPTYDPATVTEQWATLRDDPAAPLLNRATQGLVQPGTALESIVLGIALQQGTLPPPTLPLTASLPLSGPQGQSLTLTCTAIPTATTWAAALAAACPAPFAALGEQLGIINLAGGLEVWGLRTAPPLEIPTVAAPWQLQQAVPALEAVGQGELLVTPLQMAGVVAALGNDGARPPLHLLLESQAGCTAPTTTLAARLVRPDVAAAVRALWPTWAGGFSGHLGSALAGPERMLSWFLGLNSAAAPRYAVVVLLENPTTSNATVEIGTRLLQAAVAP